MRIKLTHLIGISLISLSVVFSAVSSASAGFRGSSILGNTTSASANTTGGGPLTALKGSNISTTGGMKNQNHSNQSSSRIVRAPVNYGSRVGRPVFEETDPLPLPYPTEPPFPIPPETKPNPPRLGVKWKDKKTVVLSWQDRSLVETGFRVEQQVEDGNWVLVEEFGPLEEDFNYHSKTFGELTPDEKYCFRVVAYNDIGESGSEICSSRLLADVLGLARKKGDSVLIDHDLNLKKDDIVTKVLIFEGTASTGVTLNCNGATIRGYGRDSIEVRSKGYCENSENGEVTYPKENDCKGNWKWKRPKNITIKNCNITGSVRVWGMARNGEGDPDYEHKKVLECDSYAACYWVERKVEIPGSNKFKESSKKPGHVTRARNNAPTNIVFDNVTITGVGKKPLYFGPGVTYSKLINSTLKGKAKKAAIYLDAESAYNTIKNNIIQVETDKDKYGKIPGVTNRGWAVMAVDGSSHNKIVNNTFYNLNTGGIYLYRNCGEGGTVRHSTPSHNQIINNIFYYKKYKGHKPAVYLSSRDYGWKERTIGHCDKDDGYPFGSSRSEKDFARHNIVMQNQFYKRPIYRDSSIGEASLGDMIKTKNPSVNKSNHIGYNRMVTKEDVKEGRPAGCYVVSGNRGFISHGQSFDVFTPRGNGYKYTCNNGDLIRRPIPNIRSGASVFKYKYSTSTGKNTKRPIRRPVIRPAEFVILH